MIQVFNLVFVVLFVSVTRNEPLFQNNDCQKMCVWNYKHIPGIDDICKQKCNRNLLEMDQGVSTAALNLSDPILHCLTTDALTVAWKPWDTSDAIVYLVELRNKTLDWFATNTTNNTNITFKNLIPEREYQVQIWAIKYTSVSDRAIVIGPRESQWIWTYSKNFTPPPVRNISLENMKLLEGKFQGTVQWIPDPDFPSCYYDLVLFNGQRIKEFEFRELAKTFETQFNDLDFETDVTVIILAKNEEEESKKTEMHFSTPPCLEIVGNLSVCAPETPTGLTAQEEAVQIIPVNHLSNYDVTVKWDHPKYRPDYYEIALSSTNLYLIFNVSGSVEKYIFSNVEIGHNYMIKLKAFSEGGASEPAMIQRQSTHSVITGTSKVAWIITFVGITVVMFLIVFGIGFFMFHRRAKQKRYERRCKYFEELDGKAPKTMDYISSDTGLILDESQQESDKWEILPEKLILQSVLGEGAFGLVRRAWLRDDKGHASTEVAVKMLKDAPSPDQIRQFIHEIEIMKTVGAHQHLVSLIGCCSRLPPGRGGNMMLVVEFCALGDLQNYLRNIWDHMTSVAEQPTLQYADLMTPVNSEGPTNLIINKLYDIDANAAEYNLKASDLLSFARQIAMGMEFLSSMKVLHRDLAARNVLVCADKTVKIADFGLSRDVYKENLYRKSGNGKLPIRWMAIESLTHQIYTSQSDVWSFGILLWEIATLGGNPYPSIPTNALIKFLKAGYRMEKPTNCGPELYTIMFSCWELRPKDRPTFTELRRSLDTLLESVTTSKYLDLDVLTSTEFASFRTSFKNISSLSGKNRSRVSDALSSDRYVHPLLLNNAKNFSGTTDSAIIIK